MGNQTTNLKVGTINYSGILNSPFEFFSVDMYQQERGLCKTYKEMIKNEMPDFDMDTFDWKLGKIDRKMQKQRYSPLYRKDCGIKNNKLLQIDQFVDEWNKQFEKNISELNFQYTIQEKERTRTFDITCYKAIVFYVYDIKDMSLVNKNNTLPYQNFMNKFFDKPFLRQDYKIKKTNQAINTQNIDVLFIQEANQKLFNQIIKNQNLYVGHSQIKQTLVILKKQRFTKIHDYNTILDSFGEQFRRLCFDWNNDTAVAFADKFIFISGHLSSKPDKNKEQVPKMLQSIQRLKTVYSDWNIIVGCDTNSFLQKVQKQLNAYPNDQNTYTTKKKRTMLQPQVSKAQFQIIDCKDHLITDLSFIEPKVVTIQGKDFKSLEFIPCSQHPFDHFLVVSEINTSLKNKK